MFRNLLVGVDGGQGGRDAIALAKRLGTRHADVLLAHICGAHVGPPAADVFVAAELADAEDLLKERRDEAGLHARLAPYLHRSVGRGLHELAEIEDADLLVVGSSHRGALGRVLLGDDTRRALDGAPCAVAIAPRGYDLGTRPLSSIGVGLDGSGEAELALTAARALAARAHAVIKGLSVVSLVDIPYGEPIRDNWPQMTRQLMLGRLSGVEGEVSYGDPAGELEAFSGEVDLLIVGSRSQGPVGRLFNGSTSNYLARHLRCPLLVMPRSAGGGHGGGDARAARPPVAAGTARS